MKLKSSNILFFLIIFLLLLTESRPLSAQENNPVIPKFFIGINAGPLFSQEINTPGTVISGLKVTDKSTYTGSLEVGYYFSRRLGLLTGIEYSTFGSDLSLANYINKFTTTDADNESYERRVTGSGIKETQSISYLKIPVELNLRFLTEKRVCLFIQGGINFLFPLKDDYNSSGTFSYAGYYPAYNVTFQNLPAFGFPSDASVSTQGKLTLKSTSFEGVAGAGITCFVTRNIQLSVSAFYTRSFSTISGYNSSETYQLSSDTSSINSLMGGSNKVTAQTIGLKLAIRYYIK